MKQELTYHKSRSFSQDAFLTLLLHISSRLGCTTQKICQLNIQLEIKARKKRNCEMLPGTHNYERTALKLIQIWTKRENHLLIKTVLVRNLLKWWLIWTSNSVQKKKKVWKKLNNHIKLQGNTIHFRTFLLLITYKSTFIEVAFS